MPIPSEKAPITISFLVSKVKTLSEKTFIWIIEKRVKTKIGVFIPKRYHTCINERLTGGKH
jgi:hypothetical protein